MVSSIAVYPGTFDPMTYGHIDIVKRSLRLFDTIVVAVAQDVMKETLFLLEERVSLAKQVLADIPGVEIHGFQGLLVNWMKSRNFYVIIRGVRWAEDVHYEWKMAMINQQLAHDIETIWLTAKPKHGYVAANMVRHIARLGGDVRHMVPPVVETALHRKLKKSEQ